jgi:hypothetical protein
VVPWQRADLAEFGLTPTDTFSAAWWIDANGDRHRGHRAVGHALLACGIRWQPAGWLCLTPPFSLAASLIYRVIARYRDRLPGGTPLCRTDAHQSDRSRQRRLVSRRQEVLALTAELVQGARPACENHQDCFTGTADLGSVARFPLDISGP